MRLTHKLPDRRLGKGGAKEIQNHPFFRNIRWDQVIQKSMKPPIVPAKKALGRLAKSNSSEPPNPYALLNYNFESKFYDRDINMYKTASPKNKDSEDRLRPRQEN